MLPNTQLPGTRIPDNSAGLIFPVGYYSGPFHPGGRHHVRVGRRDERLENATEFRVWALLHGLGRDGDSRLTWSPAAVEYAAAEAGIGGAGEILATLVDRGLATVVELGLDRVVTFAKSYRFCPLLTGVPQSSDPKSGDPQSSDPESSHPESGDDAGFGIGMGIGFGGTEPVVRVGRPEFELWRSASTHGSLWATETTLAAAAKRAGSTDDRLTQPQLRMAADLLGLHRLISHHAGYLDHIGGPRAARVPDPTGGATGMGATAR